MSEYEVGKDIQEILNRVKSVEGRIEQLESRFQNGPNETLVIAAEPADLKELTAEQVFPASFLYWTACPVNYQGGLRLFTGGSVLRASRIKVYAFNVKWRYAANSETITSPTGNGKTSGGGFVYPGAKEFGLVIRQPGESANQISSQSLGSPDNFSLVNTKDIYVDVNDTNGNYGDNWGCFSIGIEVVSP